MGQIYPTMIYKVGSSDSKQSIKSWVILTMPVLIYSVLDKSLNVTIKILSDVVTTNASHLHGSAMEIETAHQAKTSPHHNATLVITHVHQNSSNATRVVALTEHTFAMVIVTVLTIAMKTKNATRALIALVSRTVKNSDVNREFGEEIIQSVFELDRSVMDLRTV